MSRGLSIEEARDLFGMLAHVLAVQGPKGVDLRWPEWAGRQDRGDAARGRCLTHRPSMPNGVTLNVSIRVRVRAKSSPDDDRACAGGDRHRDAIMRRAVAGRLDRAAAGDAATGPPTRSEPVVVASQRDQTAACRDARLNTRRDGDD